MIALAFDRLGVELPRLFAGTKNPSSAENWDISKPLVL
jgi:hypothetical protein